MQSPKILIVNPNIDAIIDPVSGASPFELDVTDASKPYTDPSSPMFVKFANIAAGEAMTPPAATAS